MTLQAIRNFDFSFNDLKKFLCRTNKFWKGIRHLINLVVTCLVTLSVH